MTIHAHISNITFRLYPEDVCVDKPLHEMTEAFYGVVTAHIDDKGVGRVTALHAESFTDKDHKEIGRYLKSFGAKTLEYRHKGAEHCYLL